MRRGCMRWAALAGAAVAVGGAGVAPAQVVTTTTPTTPTTTGTAPVIPPAPVTATPPVGDLIAGGVSVEGVDVSGLSRTDAAIRVASTAIAPKRAVLVVVIRGARVPINPTAAGYTAAVERAVQAAYNVGRSHPLAVTDIPVTEKVNRATLRRVIAWRSRGHEIAAKDAATTLKGGRLVTSRARTGVAVDLERSVTLLEKRILTRTAETVTLPLKRVRPAVSVPPTAVLIERYSFRLTVVHNGRTRTFGVAVGQPAYPTPSGNFHIVDMQRNPTWYPPDSRWAAGLGPVPPGAGNPLGTRWMGISYPGVGMHGTPVPSSIGSRASHGCIRMRIPDAEALYSLVSIGTPVYIR